MILIRVYTNLSSIDSQCDHPLITLTTSSFYIKKWKGKKVILPLQSVESTSKLRWYRAWGCC